MNLAQLLHRAATGGPDRPAVALGARTPHSYGKVLKSELRKRVRNA